MKWNKMLKAAGIAVLFFSVLAYAAPSLKAVQGENTDCQHPYVQKDQGVNVSTSASHRECRV